MTATPVNESRYHHFYESSVSRVDSEVAAALESEFEYTIGPSFYYEFKISDSDYYDVLSVIDAHNSMALIELEMTTPLDVVRFLERHGLYHLIKNNRDLTATAKNLNVPVEVYLDLYSAAYGKNDFYERLLIGLESHKKFEGKRYCQRTILPLMVSGVISYDTVETISAHLLERAAKDKFMPIALSQIGKSSIPEVSYSAEDIRKALLIDVIPRRNALLSLMISVGAEAAFAMRNAMRVNQFIGRQARMEPSSYSPSLALYIDSIITETNELGSLDYGFPNLGVLRRLHLAGVEASFAAPHLMNEDFDEKRILALHEGVHSAVTEGWL